jgi:hypothetical protein
MSETLRGDRLSVADVIFRTPTAIWDKAVRFELSTLDYPSCVNQEDRFGVNAGKIQLSLPKYHQLKCGLRWIKKRTDQYLSAVKLITRTGLLVSSQHPEVIWRRQRNGRGP